MEKDFLNRFEEKLEQELLRLCTSYGMLEKVLLTTDDINEKWQEIRPEYLADAVEQVQDYPTVSVAWAAYLGMALACGWDADWEVYSKASYQAFYGEQGFDDMDEHIVQKLLGLELDAPETVALEEMIRRCAQTTVTLIRREQIEPGSVMAFHVFIRACDVMFRIGEALELKRLGYKFEKVDLSDNLLS